MSFRCSVIALLLIMAATMGLASLATTALALRAGSAMQRELALAWIELALAGIGMSVWFLQHCRSTAAVARSALQPEAACSKLSR